MAARILIIEDNATNLQLMVYLLRAFGYTVLTARNGEEGLEAASRESPELIICDMQLPGLDGYEVARQLKSHPVFHAIPLIAVTALAMVGDREKVLAAGFDGYLPKPIVPQTFVQDVAGFLGSPRPATPSLPVSTVPSRPQSSRATLLVVDNTPVNIQLVQSTLAPFGYTVLAARSVPEGLELARQHRPALILSDLHMPGEDGYALIKAVKADAQLRSIPVALLSSTVWSESDRRTALALGAVRFIVRPIAPLALLAEVEDCLRHPSGGSGDTEGTV
jgi:two-component system, cell cycle response regulator